jgi:IS5 family transposase
MYNKPAATTQQTFFFSLQDNISREHPLFILASTINWRLFENEFAKHYHPTQGCPAKPIRLMAGLLILKPVRDLSDESVVEQWSENLYYQHFCGNTHFEPGPPCAATDLVHFRRRIGEQGLELIFQESIRVNGEDALEKDVVVDTTVQEKNITFPTDAKLHRKIITNCKLMAKRKKIELRQTYTRTLKQHYLDQRFRNHPKNKDKALAADRQVRQIAGRLVRELDRKLPAGDLKRADLQLYARVLAQQKGDSNKIYSLHEPHVQCIAKGKDRVKYEFGNKVSLTKTKTTGVIVGVLSLRNPYDGHTLEPALEQSTRLTGVRARTATCDRAYKGRKEIDGTAVQIPGPFNKKKQTRYRRDKLRRDFRRRAAVEPVIGHVKSDHRMGRNFYKGLYGDTANALLSAAGFNFKRMLNKWKRLSSLFAYVFPRFCWGTPASHFALAA